MIKIKGIYKHFKGDLYIVEDIACNSENLEEMVVYRALYDDNKLWVRPRKEFERKVDTKKYPNANQEYAFELQNITSKRKEK